jgi:hypothetical protein
MPPSQTVQCRLRRQLHPLSRSEEDEELADALTPIYDQLKLSRFWWILEILPMRHRVQNRDNALWKSEWRYVIHA